MEKEILVSSGGGIDVLSQQGDVKRSAKLEGAGALCADAGCVFCACRDGVVWRLDRSSLMPQALLTAGPGVSDLLLSPDGTRLYMLLGDADSLLLSDAETGSPLVLNRCGSNPRRLRMFGSVVAAAGGESGCVHLYDAQTLDEWMRLPMPGPVYDVELSADRIYALCLTPSLSSRLVICSRTQRMEIDLPGMPGSLFLRERELLAVTMGRLFCVSADSGAVLGCQLLSGRMHRLCCCEKRLYGLDPLSESAYVHDNGVWRSIHPHAVEFAVC